jgi:hypothetical protein
MRIVGLPIVCLVFIGAIAIKAGTAASPAPDVGPSPDRTTVGSGALQDTLTKADKLEIAYVRRAVPVEPVTQFTAATAEPSLPLPAAVPKVVGRHWNDPNSIKVAKGPQDRRIKSKESKKAQESKGKNVEPSKAIVDLKPCRRREGLAGLLQFLNLSPQCDA